MREILLSLDDAPDTSMFNGSVASYGQSFEEPGEIFDPTVPLEGGIRYGWPTADFFVQAEKSDLVFRSWHMRNEAGENVAGFIADIRAVEKTGEVELRTFRDEDVKPLVIGEETVLAGLELGIIRRAVGLHAVEFIADNSENKIKFFPYDPVFQNADNRISRALGRKISFYGLTMEFLLKKGMAAKLGAPRFANG